MKPKRVRPLHPVAFSNRIAHLTRVSGSPCASIIVPVILMLISCSITWGQSESSPLLTTEKVSKPISMQLQFEFSSAQSIESDYCIALEDYEASPSAVIDEVKNHSADPSSSAIFSINPTRNGLRIRGGFSINKGKFSFQIQGNAKTNLSIFRRETSADGKMTQWTKVQTFRLGQLLSEERVTFEDQNDLAKQRWVISRIKSPPIEIDDWEIFQTVKPGQEITAKLKIAGTEKLLKQQGVLLKIYSLDDAKVVQEETYRLDSQQIDSEGFTTISTLAPRKVGVYEARLQLIDMVDHFWMKLTRPTTSDFEIRRSFLVNQSGVNSPTTTWVRQQVIQPSEPPWFAPDWLLNPKLSFPSNSTNDARAPAGLEIDQHEGETVSLISPQGSFHTKLSSDVEKLHLYSIRVPSTIRSGVEIRIGESYDSPSRFFTILPKPNADIVGAWQNLTWLHHPKKNEHLWITNADSQKDFMFHSITVEKRESQNKKTHESPDETRRSVLRMGDLSWIRQLSLDFDRSINAELWDPASVELYRLYLAVNRLKRLASDFGFDTVSIALNQNHLAWHETSEFYQLKKRTENNENYMRVILSLFDMTDIGVVIEFTPNMLFPDGNVITSDQIRLEGQLKKESVKLNLLTDSSDEKTNSQQHCFNPNTMQAARKSLLEIINSFDHHKSFSGIIVNTSGTSNCFALPSNAMQRGSLVDAYERTLRELTNTEEDKKSKVTLSFQDWVSLQQLKSWDRMLDSLKGTPTFVISNNPNDLKTDPKNFSCIEQFVYSENKNISKRLKLLNKISNGTATEAVLLSQSPQTADMSSTTNIRSQDLCEVIEKQRPNWLFVDYQLAMNHLAEQTVSNLAIFSTLPRGTISPSTPIDSATQTVNVWSFINNNHFHILLTSKVPWTTQVDIETAEPISWIPFDNGLPSRSNVASVEGIRPNRWRISIPGGNYVLLRSTATGQNSIRQWTSRVHGGPNVVKRIKQKITDVVENIGQLNAPQADNEILSNGGFEMAGEMGILGWLHAQHPAGCVELDDKVFTEGTQSVRLITQPNSTGRTWLMSETFQPPSTDRLAIGLTIRGVPSSEEKEKQIVRVAIETTQDGEPLRISEKIEVPDNSEWSNHEIVLEVDELPSESLGEMRLAIDCVSPGTVWIDNITLYERFPTQNERGQVQREVFMAVQGMQRGNILPAGKLLQNFWIQTLLQDPPSDSEDRVIPLKPPKETAPGVAERFKDWLPDSLRF